eukprot:2749178-Prymnesium_polylepis.1
MQRPAPLRPTVAVSRWCPVRTVSAVSREVAGTWRATGTARGAGGARWRCASVTVRALSSDSNKAMSNTLTGKELLPSLRSIGTGGRDVVQP